MGSVICKVAATQLGDKTVGRIVGLKTLGDAEIVDEALRKAYVSGQANIILGNFCGVMKSMVDSSRRDGNGRKIDSVCSIQPWLKGRLEDPSDPLDKSKVKVVLKARALKEMGIDVSNWTFVIEGTTGTVVINAVSTGETVGEIVLGEAVHVTGKELAMGEGDTIGWEIPEDGHHGSVSPTKVSSDATRIILAADALAELAHDEYDGKTIVFTVRGNFSSAKISATLRAATPAPHFDSATSEGCREGYVTPNSKVTVTGVGLRVPTADESFFVDMPEGKGRANFTDVSVSADGTTLTAHVGDWPEGAMPGDGYVVWLDAEGPTIAVCEVEVSS